MARSRRGACAVEPELIVDLGCGTGRFTHPLAERFQAKVSASIRRERMLDGARAKLRQRSRGVRQALGRATAAGGRLRRHGLHVDGAASSPDARRVPRECRRILREAGDCACATARAISSIPSRASSRACCRWSTPSCRRARRSSRLFEAAGLRSRAHEIVTHTRGWQLAGVCRQAGAARGLLPRPPPRRRVRGGTGRASRLRRRRAPEEITEQIDFFVFERA